VPRSAVERRPAWPSQTADTPPLGMYISSENRSCQDGWGHGWRFRQARQGPLAPVLDARLVPLPRKTIEGRASAFNLGRVNLGPAAEHLHRFDEGAAEGG
jgi:hypothetical protein